MRLSPDELIFWEYGFIKLNATIVFTWIIIIFLTLGAKLITKNISDKKEVVRKRSHLQNVLEMIVTTIIDQIEEVGIKNPKKYIDFIGTLFLFISASAICTIIPGFESPTGSLSTTTVLALSVFIAVPFFGIREQGIKTYLTSYIKPTFIMLPFNLINELSRTLALAVRLFGNMMSGAMIVAILISITPFLFPIIMNMLGLLTGIVQAYIFAILATVYIAAAINTHQPNNEKIQEKTNG